MEKKKQKQPNNTPKKNFKRPSENLESYYSRPEKNTKWSGFLNWGVAQDFCTVV